MAVKSKSWLDHFVVGIHDLDIGVQAFEDRTGVHPTYGGEHPSLGTHNALISLGGEGYLEILAPRPEASISPLFAAAVDCRVLTPILWAVATDDINVLRKRLIDAGFTPPEPAHGSRVTSEGETLRWSMFMMGEGAPANAPFFIEWEGRATHPSVSSPQGCVLGSYTIGSADSNELRRLLEVVALQEPPSVSPGGTRITLQTPRGRVDLGAST